MEFIIQFASVPPSSRILRLSCPSSTVAVKVICWNVPAGVVRSLATSVFSA